jgi:ribosomal protein L37E
VEKRIADCGFEKAKSMGKYSWQIAAGSKVSGASWRDKTVQIQNVALLVVLSQISPY